MTAYAEPELVRWTGSGDAEDKARLLRAVRAGIRRGIAAAAVASADPFGPAEPSDPADPFGPADPTGPVAFRADPVGGRGADPVPPAPGARHLAVPSYNGGGRPVAVPVTAAPQPEPGRETSFGDWVTLKPVPPMPVLRFTGSTFVQAGGQPSVTSGSLARARDWGDLLFPAQGFAVLESHNRSVWPTARFLAVPLSEPLRRAQLSQVGTAGNDDPDDPRGPLYDGQLVTLAEHSVVLVRLADEEYFLYGTGRNAWTAAGVARELRRTGSVERLYRPDAAAALSDLLGGDGAAPAGGEDQDVVVAAIVTMDRTLFGAMSWETRADYLRRLAGRTLLSARERKGLVEIVAAARTETELEAMFAILRAGGAYEQLLRRQEGGTVELLTLLGGWRPTPAPTSDYLVKLCLELGLGPSGSLESVGRGLLTWLHSGYEGIKDLFDHTLGELVEALGHLAEFAGLIGRATAVPPDPEAVRTLTRLGEQAGRAALVAMTGLEYAEHLGTTYGKRAVGTAVAGDLLAVLRTALAVEVLTWFVGIGEVKAALSSLKGGEALAAVARALAVLGRLGKGAEVAERLSKLERLLVVLSRSARILTEAQLARVLSVLSTEHLTELTRLAELLDVSATASVDALRAAAKAKGVAGDVERLAVTLAVAARLEARAAGAGVTAAEIGAALTRLVDSGLPRAGLTKLVNEVPMGVVGDWVRAVGRLGPGHVRRLGVDALAELAHAPGSLRLITEAGGDVYLTLAGRLGHRDAVEAAAEALLRRKAEVGDPAAYQRLLDRLVAGEPEVVGEVTGAVGRGAEAARGRIASGRRRALREWLAEEAEAAAKLKGRAATERAGRLEGRLARINELSDKELDGLEQLARVAEDLWDEALGLPAADRRELLHLMDDVVGRLGTAKTENIEHVVDGVLRRGGGRSTPAKLARTIEYTAQGSFGELYAARTLIERDGATALRFQEEGIGRVVDIVADTPAGRLDVEVKTLLTVGEDALQQGQVLKDLAAHAPTGYRNLRYLYHPAARGELGRLGREMLALFDHPDFPAAVDKVAARRAFEKWLADGFLTTYELGR